MATIKAKTRKLTQCGIFAAMIGLTGLTGCAGHTHIIQSEYALGDYVGKAKVIGIEKTDEGIRYTLLFGGYAESIAEDALP
jgi:hypothetical protein